MNDHDHEHPHAAITNEAGSFNIPSLLPGRIDVEGNVFSGFVEMQRAFR